MSILSSFGFDRGMLGVDGVGGGICLIPVCRVRYMHTAVWYSHRQHRSMSWESSGGVAEEKVSLLQSVTVSGHTK